MRIDQLKRKNPNTPKTRIGRGGKRGKTSGRGHKGQKARAGRKIRPEIRDMIKKIPKRRGHGKNRAKSYNAGNIKPVSVNLAELEETFESGESVNVKSLLAKGLVKKQKGKNPKIKVLGTGELKKKLNVEGLLISDSAKKKVEKVGGSIK